MPDPQLAPPRKVVSGPAHSPSGPFTAFALLCTFATVITAQFHLTSGPFLIVLTAITGAAIIAAGTSRP